MLAQAKFKKFYQINLIRLMLLNQLVQKVTRKQLVLEMIKRLLIMTVFICFMIVSECCHAEAVVGINNVQREANSIKVNENIKEIAHLSTIGFVNAVAWSPNGECLAALSEYGTRITVWDSKTWKKISEFSRYGGGYMDNSFGFVSNNVVVTSVPKGRLMEDVDNELYDYYNLMLWDINTGKLIRYLPKDPDFMPNLRYSQLMEVFTVGNKLNIIAGIKSRDPDSVSVLNAKTGEVVFTRAIPLGNGKCGEESGWLKPRNIKTVAFSKDEKYLLVGTGALKTNKGNKLVAGEGRVYFIESKSGKILKSFCVYKSSYDTYLFGLSKGDYLRVINMNDVRHVEYSPDRACIVTSGYA